MGEKIIVSLTTWSKRIKNIPVVLDTIFQQTTQPDLVVLNLAYDEVIPDDIQNYIDSHHIEVNRVPDTKVYKKLIPTLKKYPNDCIISIDDDWLYPKEMIADFVKIHMLYPDFPISGNDIVIFGLQCHCGCASLTKAEYFEEYLSKIDDEVISKCPSDDIVYTFFASLSGHPYIRAEKQYFKNMEPFGQNDGYTETNQVIYSSISQSFHFLTERFGKVPSPINYYENEYWARLYSDIFSNNLKFAIIEAENKICQSHTFRIGQFILKPFMGIKQLLRRNIDMKPKV